MMQLTSAPPGFGGTVLEPTSAEGVFELELSEAWSSLVGAHGGYMVALAVRAAERIVPDRSVRTVSTSFERSGRPGVATIRAREIRTGRSITNVAATIEQSGRTLVSARITMATPSSSVEWDHHQPLPLPPVEECVPIEPPEPVAHFARADGLLDPASLPFTNGPATSVRGYVRPLDGAPVDAAWLAMVCDWFPPPAFVQTTPPIGGISVDMLTHVHRTPGTLDDDAWLTGWFEIRTSADGLATEHGCIAMPDGSVVAESIQTRWTANRD